MSDQKPSPSKPKKSDRDRFPKLRARFAEIWDFAVFAKGACELAMRDGNQDNVGVLARAALEWSDKISDLAEPLNWEKDLDEEPKSKVQIQESKETPDTDQIERDFKKRAQKLEGPKS